MGFIAKLAALFNSGRESGQERNLGRNEPCWCGSGRKYKKCHLHEDEKKRAAASCSINCGPT